MMARMATTKRFLEWNDKFSQAEIDACRRYWLSSRGEVKYTHWTYMVFKWSHEQVHAAVYLADDTAEWQLFRVSMKGLTTHEKLSMLYQRMEEKVVGISMSMFFNQMDYAAARDKEQCRIDNYLGALVRGGQLSKTHEYVR